MSSLFPALLDDDFVSKYQDKTPPWGFDGLGYIVYKRTYARPVLDDLGEPVRTEEWFETVARVVNGAQSIGAGLTQEEAERLYDYMFNLKGSPSGRSLWQLGTENNQRLGGDSLVSCWFVDVSEPSDFSWTMERLMLGGGVGFSCNHPERLGVVRAGHVTHEDVNDAGFIVPDTRQGWGDVLRKAIECYLGGPNDRNSMSYATHLVRPRGEPIKTFGGTASGPDILIEGIEGICAVLDGAVGRELTSVEVMDCMTLIGSVVVAGNVRRSAMLAIGDHDDLDYLAAKRWDTGDIPNYRAMSNNSISVNAEQMQNIPDEVWEGYKGNGEPYGFVNIEAARQFGRTGEERLDPTIVGANPCSEIFLAHRESCNLSEVFLPHVRSEDELRDIAALLYKVQKAIAGMEYLDPTSDAITSKNMRLGVGVTGLAETTEEQMSWLDPTYDFLRALDKRWSAERGWPESVRLTTIKPSGTLSFLPGVSPGVHPGFSQYFVKRMRMAKTDPLVQYCADKGCLVEPLARFDGTDDPHTVVVEFPCAFPENTLLAKNVDAITQMELVRRMQREWADNAVSVTVYYKPEELTTIQAYLKEYWSEMKAVSFLLHSDHGFNQAPMGELTAEEFNEMSEKIGVLGEGLISSRTLTDDEMALEDSCSGGSCPIR